MKPENNTVELKGMNLDCYDGLSKNIYMQEGIDYDTRHQELKRDNLKKLTTPEEYQAIQTNPIPLISHRIFFFSAESKGMDNISIDKTSITINGLNEVSDQWQHFFWTNNPQKLPESITSLKNVLIKEIDEFQDNILWNNLTNILQESVTNKRAFSEASDLLRYISLYKYGGVYFDTDYHLLGAQELVSLMKAYNFIGGKEFDKEMSYMGSSFIAAIPEHPITETAINQAYRNLNSELSALPEYLQYPCAKFNAIMYSMGPALITLAFYKSANLNGNIDLLAMNGNVFFNQNYVQYITPNTPCSKPDKPVDFINNINGTLVKTIGADYWCHPWPNEYFDYIYYPDHLNTYVFAATLSNSTERMKPYIDAGADVNAAYKGIKPISIAVRKQNIEAVKLLVTANATIDDSLKLEAKATGNYKLSQALYKDSKIDSIGCYANQIEDIFAQEGFNYHEQNNKLIQHYKEIINNVEYYSENNKAPIPLKTHQIYVTSSETPKPIENISLNNTITTLELLNEASDQWQHYIWTNNKAAIPASISNINNVQIRLIDELNGHPLWQNIQTILKDAQSKKYFYAMAADIIRLLVLQLEGGIYRDLDNKIHPDPDPTQKLARVETLMQWLKAFNFIAGREHNKDLSFIGNAFIASIANHKILHSTLELIERNLNNDSILLPEYMQYPCNVGVKVIYDTGSPTLTSSYFKEANQNGNVDVVFPTNIFFNVEYARYIAPESRCHHLVKDAKLDNEINGEFIKSIASDPNCGSWQSLDPIEYPHYKSFKLYNAASTGDIKSFEEALKRNPDINELHNNNVNSLGIASNNGHYEIVKKLLELKANTEIPSSGYTPLYWSIQNGHYNIATLLIHSGANVNAPQINNASILYLACSKKALEIIKLLLSVGANPEIGYKDYTPEKFATINNFPEISQILLDHKLYKAAEIGNNSEVEKFLSLGADINNVHMYNTTALYIAAKKNHPSTVKLLLQNGANIDAVTSFNQTALYVAASEGYTEVTKTLLEGGANTEIKSGKFTPLVAAAHFERVADVNLLLEHDAKIISEELYTSLNVAQHKQKRTENGTIIYNNILNHYLNSKDILEPSFEVVIARYNEDLSWAIKEFGTNSKITIYNKGEDDLQLPDNFKIIKLQNTGREAHTYFHHIITNYNNLADITLFLQGHPYEHPLFLPLRRYKESVNSTCKNIIAKCTDVHPTLIEKSQDLTQQLAKGFVGYQAEYNLVEFVHRFIDPNLDQNSALLTINGAQFAVKKENILSHSMSYYVNLISVLLNKLNPLEGFYYERIWDLVFAPKTTSGDHHDLSLFHASTAGDIAEVTRLLSLGANPNKKFDQGITALHTAISKNNLNIVKLLINSGANIHNHLDGNISPLFIAVNHNLLDAAKLLIELGADINQSLIKHDISPLYKAIQLKNKEMIKLLIDSGAKFYSDKYIDAMSLTHRLDLFDIHELLVQKYLDEFDGSNANISECNIKQNDKKFEVVVVRYNEDISLLQKEFPCDKVTIYNKGADTLTTSVNHQEIKLPNIGYYEGAILNHIVDNYYNLPERMLFLQANPYDAYIYLPLNRFKDNLNSTCKNIIGKCEPGHNLLRESEAMQKFDWETGIRGKYKNFNYQDNDLFSFANFYLDVEIPQSFPICYAGLFAVDKDVILRHPIEYYQRLANSINYTQYPIEGFYFERIWDLVFDHPLDESNSSCNIEFPW
jgi:ankyrin repeat protein/mannosyltransferase OCH1-like enzyme